LQPEGRTGLCIGPLECCLVFKDQSATKAKFLSSTGDCYF